MIKSTYYQDLTKMNTFRMKVKAKCFIEYDLVADLVDIEFDELSRPILHIGGGSNLLFTEDFKGTVLHSKINFIEILDECQSIPEAPSQASLGPSPYPGVGKCLLHTDGTSPESNAETASRLTPMMVRKVIIKIRKEKLPEPSVVGSAGSFFKNPVISREHFERIEAAAKAEFGPDYKVPHYIIETEQSPCHPEPSACHPERSEGSSPEQLVKVPAAWMIEQCGWKGRRSGGAAVWEKQPLVIVNYTGEAYPEEIVGLEKRIIASVKAKFGVELHPEVEHI